MRAYDLISKKKNGLELSDEEINWFVNGYINDTVPDYQMSAFLMAVCLKGMSKRETVTLTMAIRDSGDVIDFPEFRGRTVDKHSTGGVGDKNTLAVAPIAASLGCVLAKMSGRGLGHTGGTVDKLESIKGFNAGIGSEEFLKQVREIGIAVTGQSGNMTPADKKIYALRDVTATVDSIPLIASSIMGKKLASGADNIILDVKCGNGAFMKTPEEALELANEMVMIGKSCGKNTSAIVSEMNRPLGYAVGNAIEVAEALKLLKCEDDARSEDFKEECIVLSSKLACMCFSIDYCKAEAMVKESLSSGRAYEKFRLWISRQGGDLDFLENIESYYKEAHSQTLVSDIDGYIGEINALTVGNSAMMLGAGRQKKDDVIDMRAGIEFFKKVGEKVSKGDILAVLYSTDESKIYEAKALLGTAYKFCKDKPFVSSLIYNVI